MTMGQEELRMLWGLRTLDRVRRPVGMAEFPPYILVIQTIKHFLRGLRHI